MKKRIFVDAHVFDGGFQGSRSFIKGIYTELLNHPDLEISFAGRNREALEAAFPHPRARFLPLTSNSSTRRLAWELPRLLRKNHFDYAHFQYIIPPVPTCPLIVTIHDVLFDDFPALFSPSYRLAKHMLYRYAAQKADVLTTVSDHSAQSIRKNLGVKNKIVMTPSEKESRNGSTIMHNKSQGLTL